MSKEDNKFPIIPGETGSVKFVKWDMLSEEWAQKNHSQTLTRLAERGGLCWAEIYCNYYKQRWSDPRDPKLHKDMVDRLAI
jgi:hypothetical protein